MNQLELFPQKKTEAKNKWQIFVDGASRNNPGLSGAGIFIKKDEKPFLQKSFFLNIKTNNEAEYLALLLGLFLIKDNLTKNDFLEIVSDSELLVKQIKGIYKVKKPELKELFNIVKLILNNIEFNINHVLREKNKKADELANEAIDKRSRIPDDLLSEIKSHGISI